MQQFISLLFISLWGTCALGASPGYSESNVPSRPFNEIQKHLSNLQKRHPELVELRQYGKSWLGQPLNMIVIGNHRQRAKQAVLITGSTHGSEYLNIVDRLPKELIFKSHSHGPVQGFIKEGGLFIVVPIVNPDGYITQNRYNARGIDLNRGWSITKDSGPSERESQALSNSLDAFVKEKQINIVMTVDYHCCRGALLWPWSYKKDPLPDALLRRHQSIATMAEEILSVRSGTTFQLLGYAPQGTTKDYYHKRFGALAFTFEGRKSIEPQYFDKHVTWWEKATKYISNQFPTIRNASITSSLNMTIAD